MAKVATDFMKYHNWTSETLSSELAKYTEKINKSLKDDYKDGLAVVIRIPLSLLFEINVMSSIYAIFEISKDCVIVSGEWRLGCQL
ncbi:12627_t:CDS:2 [Funneliformis geosporum]|uniref:17368_t:CDS:1 n=1 Tax=Funneliformis geosporum TaxID=1117311 RepID=A0A9W4WXY7_9GLOM|nr:17368_t:CDS:2 [Funneliformis geosporum]CAI2183186.1 12627_t:CDS:2 [Funneliformis geosporum]